MRGAAWTNASWGRKATTLAMISVIASVVVLFVRARTDEGARHFYRDQTYHHQVLRALNQVAAQGADVTEVLAAIQHVRAGDADGWYDAWTALGDRNMARARATHDATSRGEALLRAHTYYLRAEFFLPSHDGRRQDSFARNKAAFYEGLDALGIGYERIAVPYGEAHHLNALFYPAPPPARTPLLLFCGGFDSTMEELYFFLVAAARARGYSVLTFEGPGQGSILREQGLPFTPEWEKPTAAVLDAYLAHHPAPAHIVMVGLSMGGYLAPRAAAFDTRIDAVASYDVFFDGGEVARRSVPRLALWLGSLGLGSVVDVLADLRGRFDPGSAWTLSNGRWTFAQTHALDVVDAAAHYTLAGVAERIHQDVLILAGEDDQFVPLAQVDAYRNALVHARSVTTHIYDDASGGAEHSQLGAPTLWQADFFDWVDDKMGGHASAP